MKAFYFLLFTFYFTTAYAQYPPQAGLAGSTAISASAGVFTGWATSCSIQRGFLNIADPSLGYASAGASSNGAGAADGNIVSLGDSGIAILTFATPIYNGPGADFVVFENGFRDVADSSEGFLELAFVEVSSDGVNYFRFPAASLTQVNTQLGNGDYIDATKINNLAGKYVSGYGTPFDLQDMIDTPGLDVNHITNVRLVDVVGAITGHTCSDNAGRVINDPYPTPFASGGFDLDAVGAIHQVTTGVGIAGNNAVISVYPNPATDNIIISISGQSTSGISGTVTSVAGSVLQRFTLSQQASAISIGHYPTGMYYLILQDTNGNKWVEKIIKL